MMNEVEFKEMYEKDKQSYYNWGIYVQKEIIDSLKTLVNTETFLKINCSPRLKDTNSLIQKAFYRDKKYDNPYTDITDKVGIRFVVLLNEDIKKVSKIIETNENWDYSKDRDYETERDEKPEIFTYQSVHYIVRSKKEFIYNDFRIPEQMPCEIQIRTLLQHSYSELTHDTIYKEKTKSKPKVYRIVARSMALIEATDEQFGEVSNMLRENDELYDTTIQELNNIYSGIAKADYSRDLSIFILDAYQDILQDIDFEKVKDIIIEPSIKDLIKSNYEKNLLYRQPVILLLYYLVLKKAATAKKYWPLPESELEPIFYNLGKNFSN